MMMEREDGDLVEVTKYDPEGLKHIGECVADLPDIVHYLVVDGFLCALFGPCGVAVRLEKKPSLSSAGVHAL